MDLESHLKKRAPSVPQKTNKYPVGTFSFFNNGSIKIHFSSLDETAELVEEFANLFRLERSDGLEGIRIGIFSSDRPPAEIDGIWQGTGKEGRWRSYDVTEMIRIFESPDRTQYLCGLRGYPSWYPTQQVKWSLMSMVFGGVLALLSDRLLLIHGALITNNDVGYILTGPSGAGKSTAASRVPSPWLAPADDLIAAVDTSAGYLLLPLPTWSQLDSGSDEYRPPDLNRSYPASGIYFLEQSTLDVIEDIPSNDAITRLFRNSYILYLLRSRDFSDEDRLRCKSEVLMHVTRILSQTPCGVIKVSKEGRFWELFPTG